MPAKMNFEKPHSEMCGEPGVAFLQNGHFYDRNGFFVRDSGIPGATRPHLRGRYAEVGIKKRQEQLANNLANHSAVLRRAAEMLGPFARPAATQRPLEDIERENHRALVAEERYVA